MHEGCRYKYVMHGYERVVASMALSRHGLWGTKKNRSNTIVGAAGNMSVVLLKTAQAEVL